MTIRTCFLLFGIGCSLLAAVIFSNLIHLDYDIREDVHGWAWLGVASIAASQLPWGTHWFGRGPSQ